MPKRRVDYAYKHKKTYAYIILFVIIVVTSILYLSYSGGELPEIPVPPANFYFESYEDLGTVVTASDFGVTNFEDPVTIKAHDNNYYMFCSLLPYTGIVCVKSTTVTFDTVENYGTVLTTNERIRAVVYDSTAKKYYLITNYHDTVCWETTEAQFPKGWTNPVSIIPLGMPGTWDERDAAGSYLFKVGDTYYFFYMGVDATYPSPGCGKFGYAYGKSLRSPLTKYLGNPILAPSSSWVSRFWSPRGGIQFGTEAVIALEGKSDSKWSVGFFIIKGLGGSVTVEEYEGNPVFTDPTLSYANPEWLARGEGETYSTSPYYLYLQRASGANWNTVNLIKYTTIRKSLSSVVIDSHGSIVLVAFDYNLFASIMILNILITVSVKRMNYYFSCEESI